MKTRRLLSKACALCGCLTLGVLAVHGILIGMVRSYSAETGAQFEGLGRRLVPAPPLYRILYPDEPLWPGLSWVLVDFLSGFAILGCCALFFWLARKLDDRPRNIVGRVSERESGSAGAGTTGDDFGPDATSPVEPTTATNGSYVVGGERYLGIEKLDRFYRENRGNSAVWANRPLSAEKRETLREMDELGPGLLSPMEARQWGALRLRARAEAQRRETLNGWLGLLFFGGYLSAIITLQEAFERTGVGAYRVLVVLLVVLFYGGLSAVFVASFLARFLRPEASRASDGDDADSQFGVCPDNGAHRAGLVAAAAGGEADGHPLFQIEDSRSELTVCWLETSGDGGGMSFQVQDAAGRVLYEEPVPDRDVLDALTVEVLDEGWRPWLEGEGAASQPAEPVLVVPPTAAAENFWELQAGDVKANAVVRFKTSGLETRLMGRVICGPKAGKWKAEVLDPGSNTDVKAQESAYRPEAQISPQTAEVHEARSQQISEKPMARAYRVGQAVAQLEVDPERVRQVEQGLRGMKFDPTQPLPLPAPLQSPTATPIVSHRRADRQSPVWSDLMDRLTDLMDNRPNTVYQALEVLSMDDADFHLAVMILDQDPMQALELLRNANPGVTLQELDGPELIHALAKTRQRSEEWG